MQAHFISCKFYSWRLWADTYVGLFLACRMTGRVDELLLPVQIHLRSMKCWKRQSVPFCYLEIVAYCHTLFPPRCTQSTHRAWPQFCNVPRNMFYIIIKPNQNREVSRVKGWGMGGNIALVWLGCLNCVVLSVIWYEKKLVRSYDTNLLLSWLVIGKLFGNTQLDQLNHLPATANTPSWKHCKYLTVSEWRAIMSVLLLNHWIT